MFKVFALITLALIGANAQGPAPPGGEASAEPYSYGYETETHSASEQRDPSGTVTGFYTIADPDGRSRRIEYTADESGFHARVQTNEVGMKSGSSADVEVQASPPTPEQLAYSQQQQQQSSYATGAAAPQASQAMRAQSSSYSQQQQQPGYASHGYGYYPGYGQGYYPGYGYGQTYQYGVAGQPSGYAMNSQQSYGSGYGSKYSSYNNHLPSQYFKSISQQQISQQPSAYSVGGNDGSAAAANRYSASSVSSQGPISSSYRSYQQSYGAAPAGFQTASAGPVGGSYQSRSSYSSSSSSGSSAAPNSNFGSPNYIVLKKRDSKAASTQDI